MVQKTVCITKHTNDLIKKELESFSLKSPDFERNMDTKMQTKYLPLLKQLFEANTWITAASLANTLGISVRTIKTYISELNSSYEGIISSSRKGYLIDHEIDAKALKETKSCIPQTARERVAYIMKRVCREPVSFYDLCEELFISSSTLYAVLPRIRKQLETFHLTLHISSDIWEIKGLEKNKRKLLIQLLYHESNENFVNLETIQSAFPDIDIIFIKNIVLETLSEYRYFINDYSLSNLVLHIAIAADRIKNNSGYGEYEQAMGTLNLLPHEYELSQKIVERLEEHFRLKFSAGEVQEMTLLLVSRATSLNYNSITVDNLVDIIGKDCIDLVYELVNAIGSYYYINLNEPEFLIRFALHIKNLLIRAQNEHFCKNPLGDTLKATCPLIYDDAVCCSSIIKDWTGISINDDEISYIAFHLGSTLETQKALASKLSAVIYCPTYYNMGTRLLETISSRLDTELLIANIITEEADLDKITTPDLIICTVPVNRSLVTPFVQVQPFLMESDVIAIRQKIDEIRTSKKRETFTAYLHQIILPDFFERGDGFPCREDAIHYLCEKFRQKGYVEKQFEVEVLEREEMSSTGFQNFAIPHSMRMRAKKTGMYLYLCDTPTDWNGMPISLIIMLCFNRDERYIFNEIFEPLTMILTEPNNLKKALTFHEYEAFIEFLSGCL